jgi:hypothetical protein
MQSRLVVGLTRISFAIYLESTVGSQWSEKKLMKKLLVNIKWYETFLVRKSTADICG